MSNFASILLSLGVCVSFVFIGVGIAGVVRKEKPPIKPWLMIGVGAVTLLNIYFYSGIAAH
jgi:hypothetical protein